jgi:hypothetical protein
MGYVTQSPDTSEAVEKLQFERLRRMGRKQRLESGLGRIDESLAMMQRALRRLHPDWTPLQLQEEWIRVQYGPELAERVTRHVQNRKGGCIQTPFGII